MRKKRMLKKTPILTLACAVVLTVQLNSALAEEAANEYALDQVVVTATKTSEKLFDTKADVTVITRAEIEKKHYADLGEALKNVPGVTLQNYGASGDNYTANRLYINGSDKIVVLIDGMRANVNGSVSTKFSPSEIADLAMVERIEVLKGSSSTLYGSDAQGGVINIITRKMKDGQSKTVLGSAFGSFGKTEYSFVNSGSANGYYWTIADQKRSVGNFKDGYGNSIIQDINADTVNFTFGKRLNKTDEVAFTYQSYQSDYIRPTNGGLTVSAKSFGEKNNDRLSLMYSSQLTSSLKNQLFVFRNRNYLNDNYKDPANVWLMDLETVGFSDQLTYASGNHTVVGGFDFYQDKVKRYSSTSYGSTDAYHDITLTDRAVYVQDEWKVSPQWSLTPGIRVDDHSEYGTHNTPSLTLGYQPNNRTNYYVSYKEFFVAPNQFQIYSKYGGKNLTPEEGHTVEFGVNHKLDRSLTGSLHVYQREAENMIGYRSLSSYPYIRYYNTGEETSRGGDVQFTKQFNDRFSASVGYTYTYIEAKTGQRENRDGYIPRGAWNIGLNYVKSKFDVAVDGRCVVNRDGSLSSGKNANVDEGLTTFWIWDMAVNYKVSKDVKAFLKVNNIFNKFYTDQLYDMNPSGQWYSAPGRNITVGMEYSF